MDVKLYSFEGQKARARVCADNGIKRSDFYASELFQRGVLVATVVSNGLSFAAQTCVLFEKGVGEDATGALFPSGYLFTEVDTNVEKKGLVAPPGMCFAAQSASVFPGRPFVDSSGSISFPEWLESYAVPAIEGLLDHVQLALLPDGARATSYSLGSLAHNPSFRGIRASDTLPTPNQAAPGMPAPSDAEIEFVSEQSIARLVIPRGIVGPARATVAAATCYFPFTVSLEGRPQMLRTSPTQAREAA